MTPEILAARELRRGTLQLIEDIAPYRHLGIEPPPLRLLINRVHPVSSNARLIQQALRDVFQGQAGVHVLDTDVPAIEAYPRAATEACRCTGSSTGSPTGRTAPAALDTMRALAGELFPHGGSASRWSPAGPMREGPAMANAHELARGHKRLRALIEFALGEGWHVVRTPGGHLKFTKQGCAPIYTSSTAERPPRRPQRPRAASPRRPEHPPAVTTREAGRWLN